jgi:hypothetical protein
MIRIILVWSDFEFSGIDGYRDFFTLIPHLKIILIFDWQLLILPVYRFLLNFG